MLITPERKVPQRSDTSQNDHKSKGYPPKTSTAVFTMQKSDTGALRIRLFIRLFKIRLNSPIFDPLFTLKFCILLIWVPILAAEGPYFIKSWVPIGSLFLSSQDSQILVWGDKNSDWSPQMYSIYEDQTHVRSREGAEEQVKLKHALVDIHRLSEWPDCRISRAPCPTISRMPCSSSSSEAPSSFDSTFCWSRERGLVMQPL